MAAFCTIRKSRPLGRQVVQHCLLAGLTFALALIIGAGESSAWAQPSPSPATSYWKQRIFFIPYQLNQQPSAHEQLTKVRLLLSRNGMSDWQNLQEAAPHVQGFTYHAPQDGDYWFAVRMVTKQGDMLPRGAVRPQLHIVVDTKQPELTLFGALDATGAIVLRYEAQDLHLQPESLSIEAKAGEDDWTAVSLGDPDVSQPDRLIGRVHWPVPKGVGVVLLRGKISDRAGHFAQSETKVALAGPSLNMATLDRAGAFSRSSQSRPSAQPSALVSSSPAGLPVHDWPVDNAAQTLPVPNVAFSAGTPPEKNAYTARRSPGTDGPGWPARTPAQLFGDSRAQEIADDRARPPALIAGRSTKISSTRPQSADNDGWTQPTHQSQAVSKPRMVNSHTFDVEYELDSIGPWGVAKVELWGTPDGGRTWRSFGIDPDNRSPMRVTVPGAGTYGFRILVDGANGVGAMPPRSGEAPELVVTVDLQPPTAELVTAKFGRGNQADHLLIHWSADDSNLEPRPIGLFYSTHPNGPWSTIAAGLENTGRYIWRLERHVPDRFFLRLEARDTAGNLATFHTETPIALDRPQPTGRLRSVRPVEAEPSAFRTADREP